MNRDIFDKRSPASQIPEASGESRIESWTNKFLKCAGVGGCGYTGPESEFVNGCPICGKTTDFLDTMKHKLTRRKQPRKHGTRYERMVRLSKCPVCHRPAWQPDIVERPGRSLGKVYRYRRYRHPIDGRTGRNRTHYVTLQERKPRTRRIEKKDLRRHDSWWQQQKVRALVELRNHREEKIPKGTICEVQRKFGGFNIYGAGVVISHVPPSYLEFVTVPEAE